MWHQMHSINLIAVDRTAHLHIFQSHLLAILTLHLIMYQVCEREREQISKFVVEFGFYFFWFFFSNIIYILFYGRRPFSVQTCAELTDVPRFLSYFIYISHYSLLDETLWAISLCHGHYQCHLFSFSADTHTHTLSAGRYGNVQKSNGICTRYAQYLHSINE